MRARRKRIPDFAFFAAPAPSLRLCGIFADSTPLRAVKFSDAPCDDAVNGCATAAWRRQGRCRRILRLCTSSLSDPEHTIFAASLPTPKPVHTVKLGDAPCHYAVNDCEATLRKHHVRARRPRSALQGRHSSRNVSVMWFRNHSPRNDMARHRALRCELASASAKMPRRLCVLGLTDWKCRDAECADTAFVGARRPCKALLGRRART